jgi:molecular chaperone DnaK
VKAKDLDTQKEAKIEIKGSSGLSHDEVERMRKDAEGHAAEEKKRVELIDARNQADNVIYQVEKQLKEHGDKLSETDKKATQSAVDRTREAMKGDDVAAIKNASTDLVNAVQALAQFAQGQGPGAAGGFTPGGGPSGDGSQGGGKGKDDVIDAEFEVKK